MKCKCNCKNKAEKETEESYPYWYISLFLNIITFYGGIYLVNKSFELELWLAVGTSLILLIGMVILTRFEWELLARNKK